MMFIIYLNETAFLVQIVLQIYHISFSTRSTMRDFDVDYVHVHRFI